MSVSQQMKRIREHLMNDDKPATRVSGESDPCCEEEADSYCLCGDGMATVRKKRRNDSRDSMMMNE